MNKNTTKLSASSLGADEREYRGGAPEVRGDVSVRQDAERTGETGLMSTDELEQLLRSEFDQVALPNPPKLTGFHLCWLTTTSTYDSISKRGRLGYTPVRRSEMPSFDPSNGKELEQHEGFVTCNEMVLHKIPEQIYQGIMRHFHHKRPLEDEQAIVSRVKDGNAANRDSQGQAVGSIEGDGLNNLAARAASIARQPEPSFA